ncbi:MAG TPA: cytochrome c biogenesis protein ResB [Sulfurihydrogenibium azorense]|uniref:Cytochrome c biogenesis protein ResB n=1 Tax=Sulfurihydrogenibium azorense TaxID=309806 RepID=A0A832DAB4_9AQUI|nr:MAG: cytochrome c biogenesis protein [Sulfurihydrogenibium sp.]HEV09333.1 cytochrome c biogenesis protein ResB [Sulfurihydrogenibium azorense]
MIKKVVSFLGNVKLGVAYLIALAILSVLGSTYIKQGETYITYYKEYGEIPAKIIWITWLNNVFHAWYYQLLIVLVAIAVIFATIERFPAIYKSAYGKVEKKLPEGALKKPSTIHITYDFELKKTLDYIVNVIHRLGFRKVEAIKENENTVYLYAEKGKISRLGMLVTHVGIIVFLIGAFMGSVLGVRGQIEIPEGESADYIRKYREGSLVPGDETYKLPFTILLKKFSLEFYDSKEFAGAVKSYKSDVDIIKNGKVIKSGIIEVNKPMEVEGHRIFQTSYGKTGEIKEAKLLVFKYDELLDFMNKGMMINQKLASETDENKKKEYEKQLRDLDRQWIDFINKTPKLEYSYRNPTIKFNDFSLKVKNTTLNYKNPMLAQQDVYDPLIVAGVDFNGKNFDIPITRDPFVAIPAYDRFSKPFNFPYVILIDSFEPRYFSGLQVSYFPGTDLIWLGTVVVVLGTMLAFYTVHRRVWVKIEKREDNKTDVYLAFYSQKFKESFHEKIKEELGLNRNV